jgi:hypothetical protein
VSWTLRLWLRLDVEASLSGELRDVVANALSLLVGTTLRRAVVELLLRVVVASAHQVVFSCEVSDLSIHAVDGALQGSVERRSYSRNVKQDKRKHSRYGLVGLQSAHILALFGVSQFAVRVLQL